MERFWPGPLTLVLPARPELGADLGDDELTIGLRCPAHAVPLALCRAVGPLATTSANLHGDDSLTTATEVAAAFGDNVPVVLDAGGCTGSPSTVVDARRHAQAAPQGQGGVAGHLRRFRLTGVVRASQRELRIVRSSGDLSVTVGSTSQRPAAGAVDGRLRARGHHADPGPVTARAPEPGTRRQPAWPVATSPGGR